MAISLGADADTAFFNYWYLERDGQRQREAQRRLAERINEAWPGARFEPAGDGGCILEHLIIMKHESPASLYVTQELGWALCCHATYHGRVHCDLTTEEAQMLLSPSLEKRTRRFARIAIITGAVAFLSVTLAIACVIAAAALHPPATRSFIGRVTIVIPLGWPSLILGIPCSSRTYFHAQGVAAHVSHMFH